MTSRVGELSRRQLAQGSRGIALSVPPPERYDRYTAGAQESPGSEEYRVHDVDPRAVDLFGAAQGAGARAANRASRVRRTLVLVVLAVGSAGVLQASRALPSAQRPL